MPHTESHRKLSALWLPIACCFLLGGCGGGGSGGVFGGGGSPPPVASDDASLVGLTVSLGTLYPAFDPDNQLYVLAAGFPTTLASVTATSADPGATIRLDVIAGGTSFVLESGVPSAPNPFIGPGVGGFLVEVTAANGTTTRTYEVITPFSPPTGPQTYAKASNTGSNDHFGRAVAASGDTVVIGAWNEDSASVGVDGVQANELSPNSGAVYVLVKSGDTWVQQAYLKASNTGSNDTFGIALALDGDTLVVGAPSESSNATGIDGPQGNDAAPTSGAVYVFVRTGSTWAQQAYIKASNTQAGDLFGTSVALSGDLLAVGATGEASLAAGVNGDQVNNLAPGSGAVYVFRRAGATWTQEAYVKASNTQGADTFGASVAVAFDRLVVGAPFEDSNATGANGNQASDSMLNSGAVYLFQRAAGVWSQEAYLKAPNTGAGDQYGTSLALSSVGDLFLFEGLSIRIETLVVGAPFESSNATGLNGDQTDNSASGSGAVYVYENTFPFSGEWDDPDYLKASNTAIDDHFGLSVALVYGRIVVGAPGEDSDAGGVNGDEVSNTAPDSGAVYAFLRDGSWGQDAYIKATNTRTGDGFGFSVALSGGRLVVGAPFQDGNVTGIDGNQTLIGSPDSGAAYILP